MVGDLAADAGLVVVVVRAEVLVAHAGVGQQRVYRVPGCRRSTGESRSRTPLSGSPSPSAARAVGPGSGTCIRLDATVTPAHSDKQGAGSNFKGYGLIHLLAYCDNPGGEPLAGLMRRGGAGSNTVTGRLAVLDAAIAAVVRRPAAAVLNETGAAAGTPRPACL